MASLSELRAAGDVPLQQKRKMKWNCRSKRSIPSKKALQFISRNLRKKSLLKPRRAERGQLVVNRRQPVFEKRERNPFAPQSNESDFLSSDMIVMLQHLSIDTLIPYDRNNKIHDEAQIKKNSKKHQRTLIQGSYSHWWEQYHSRRTR